MRNRLLLAGILLAFAAVIATAPINAVAPPPSEGFICSDGSMPYIVQLGDTIWAKAGGLRWKEGWGRLVEQNSWLANRRVDRSADDIYVHLGIGELICGLEASGLEIRNEGEVRGEPDSRLATLPLVQAVSVPSAEAETDSDGFGFPWWWWLLIVILGIAFLVWLWRSGRRQQERMRHPATLGPPIVEGGIGHLGINEVAAHMDRQALREEGLDQRVSGPDRVRLIRKWRFKYADGKARVGICSGRPEDRAYRSVYRDYDGGDVELFTLVDCGNDGQTVESLGGSWVLDPLPQTVQPPPPVRTFTWPDFLRWRDRNREEGVPCTRERVQTFLIDLEMTGVVVTAFDEVIERQLQLEEEVRRLEDIRQEQRRIAAELRRRAARSDTAVTELGSEVERVQRRKRALQPDIDLLSSHKRPPDENATAAPVPDETSAVAESASADGDGTEATPETPAP